MNAISLRRFGRLAWLAMAAVSVSAAAGQAAELIAYFPFEETAPGAIDDFGGIFTPNDVHSSVTLNAAGYEGQAAEFHGAGAIRLPLDISPGVSPKVTIGAWVNADNLSDRAAWGHDNGGWDRGLDLIGGTWRPTGGSNWDSGIAGSVGNWQFVAVSYDGNAATKLYVDNLTYTKLNPTAGVGRTELGIGSFSGFAVHPFDGRIDNFFILDGVAADDQINAIRTGGAAALESMYTPRTLSKTWDFETGDLTGWNIVNTTIGDDLVFTTPGNMPSALPHSGTYDDATVQGNYWIRTWEGEVLGSSDGHTGIIESDEFTLGAAALFRFLIGGGNHPFSGDPDTPGANITALNLERKVGPGDWEMLFTASGMNNNYLSEAVWDASAFAGDTVRLRIYDTATGGWGHIGVDNIRLYVAPEPAAWALLTLGTFVLLLRRRRRR